MGIAVRNEGTKVNSNINVTPMVDVMLVLLIIFMVITPMLQSKVQINMAQVDNPTSMPDADKEDAIVVAVTRSGDVFLGQNRTSVNELGVQVREKLAADNVPNLWVPKRIRRVEKIPVLGTGKLDLKRCRELALESVGEGAAEGRTRYP